MKIWWKPYAALLSCLLLIAAIPLAASAQPVINSIDDLKMKTDMRFHSAAGKDYLVWQSKGSCNVTTRRERRDIDDNTTACDGDDFDGKARKAAKTSYASGSNQSVDDYKAFVKTLPTDNFMCKTREPEILQSASSNRVEEEKINVSVTGIWLYAFKRQKDEDYHLMVGTSSKYSDAKKNKFYNMEISGYPENGSDDFDDIKKARDFFEKFFGITDCAVTCRNYVDFKENPIKIEVTGSMFYDKDHCSNLKKVSPADYTIKTAWEVHPIKKIKFIEN